MICPSCCSTHAQLVPYDFGVESQTGYSDKGEILLCLECGEHWEGKELERIIAGQILQAIEAENFLLASQEEAGEFRVLALAGCSLTEAATVVAIEKGWRN